MMSRYDAKEWTKAMEIIDELLKAFPDHAETLAFRALILQGMQKEDEALAGMKEILKNFKNFKNYTVWHIYGMINK
jgi:tetratricopeptide (TPR) repeat protein